MFKISRLADYATVIMSHLASQPRVRYSAARVAEETRLPVPTVSKVLKLLNEASLVLSKRGANGGYRLSMLPEEIKLGQIIFAIDGVPAITDCNKGETFCSRVAFCTLRSQWNKINAEIFNLLNGFTLAEMSQPLNNSGYCYRKNFVRHYDD